MTDDLKNTKLISMHFQGYLDKANAFEESSQHKVSLTESKKIRMRMQSMH